MLGATLTTTPEDQYRALLESTAFGTRVIIDAFREAGVAVGDLVIAGGLVKNPLLMQIYADVTGLPLTHSNGLELFITVQKRVAVQTTPSTTPSNTYPPHPPTETLFNASHPCFLEEPIFQDSVFGIGFR